MSKIKKLKPIPAMLIKVGKDGRRGRRIGFGVRRMG
jgi:hypothetical protein